MSEYVRIESSPSEIIAIGNNLSAQGRELVSMVDTVRVDITTQEERGETFPDGDQFVEAFRPIYYQPSEDAKGDATTANLAVVDSAAYCGHKLVEIGETVTQSMVSYVVTDQESGDGIADSN